MIRFCKVVARDIFKKNRRNHPVPETHQWPPPKILCDRHHRMRPRKALFLSDLHLLAKRSTAKELTPMILESAKQSHTMILGGDIFDFKWSTCPDLESSIARAMQWLETLVTDSPDCEFHYVLGNHDSHPGFVTELERFASRQSRLRWHRYELRIGQCVFLHGDIVDAHPCKSVMDKRRVRLDSKPRPAFYAHWLYDWVVHARLHRAAMHLAIRQHRVLSKLTQYLADEGLSVEDGVRHVYFGHTHRVVNGVLHRGLTFHNGGAAIRGLPFQIIETRLP